MEQVSKRFSSPMLTDAFLSRIVEEYIYVQNPASPTSYYEQSLCGVFECFKRGEQMQYIRENLASLQAEGKGLLLPYRIGLCSTEIAPVSNTGRARNREGADERVMMLKANFTQIQESPYKQYPKYEVHSSIWKRKGYQRIYYGTIGLTGPTGQVREDNGDLILFLTADWKKVNVYIFKGLAGKDKQLNHLQEAIDYVNKVSIR